jgi:metal-dependent HD superfamily phosphatase/phosphodiesterase
MMSQQGNFTGNEADMTYKEIRKNKEINAYIKKGNDNLGVLGYTDHSQVHCTLVAERAAMILEKFGCTEHDIELVKIAGYMHDIGNSINRKNHAEYGALLANELLQRTDMSLEDRVTVVSAIANHDESTGGAVDIISAALIIADKTDVRRDRVREKDKAQYDIHDRVNYAVEASALKISTEKKQIALNLQIDESICTMYDYFDIFLGRMQMCRHAAEFFDARFKLTANGSKVL